MKLGLKTLVIALVMALAAVPAAFAGNGHGGGKPSWAGQGKPSSAGQGKPSWAGQGHAAHTDKEKKPKHEQSGSADVGTQSTDLEGLNPAKYCRAIQDEANQLASDFASMFGTNPNNANAFGKCVSRRAHGEDLSSAAGGDQQDNSCDTTTESPATDTTVVEDGGTDTTVSGDEGTSTEGTSGDEAAQDESSDDEATDPEECDSNDSSSDEPADDEQAQGDDEQGEDDQGQDEDDTSGGLDSSDLARVLRFLRL